MFIDESTFQLLKTLIKKDGSLELPSYGNSMFPFIQEGNLCRFVPYESSILKKGDVILYHSHNDQLIAHRFVSIKMVNHQVMFQLKGDTNLGFDQLIGEERILGKLVNIQKSYKTVNPEDRMARIWGIIILSFPALSGILRKYLNWKLQY
jgi:signal peptidase I